VSSGKAVRDNRQKLLSSSAHVDDPVMIMGRANVPGFAGRLAVGRD
jgi:hypothetical protein